jgi:hypothetical protein
VAVNHNGINAVNDGRAVWEPPIEPYIFNDLNGNSLTFHGGAQDDDGHNTVAVEAEQIGRGTAWVHVRHADAARVADGLRAAAGLPPVDPAAAWLDAAAECNKAAGAYAERGANDAASAAFTLMETFIGKAGEAEYTATPCSGPVPCEDGGEPCDVHERLMAHAEGEHELCAPDCGDAWARRITDKTQEA